MTSSRAPRSRSGTCAFAALVFLAFSSGGASCHPTDNVSFTLDIPSAIIASASWYEIAAFPGGSCASLLPTLAGGIPALGASSRVVFQPSDNPLPALGDLPRATYAFAVTAKDAGCNVVATGCTSVDVDSSSSVEVPLSALDPPSGGCTGATSCVDGECVPPGEGTVDIGAGCSLALVGAGPLAEALQPAGGEATSAPAIVPTANGFLVAYREFDQSTESARVTTFAIDPNASAGTPVYTNLPQRCRVVESDATGLAWNGTEGLVVVSHALCPAMMVSGEDTLRVDINGILQKSGLNSILTKNEQGITLSTAHAVAADPTGPEFYVANVVSNAAPAAADPFASFALTDGLAASLAAQYSTPATAAGDLVASTSQVLATVALGSGVTSNAMISTHVGANGTGGTGGPVDGGDDDASSSAGDDAGSAFGDDDSSVSDVDSGAVLTAFVHSGAPSVGFSSLPLTGSFAASWVSLTVDAGRVFTVSGTGGGAELRSIDIGGMASAAIPVSLSGDGAVTYADASLAGDHLFLAVARPGALALLAYENATATPKLLRQIDLDKDPRVGTFTDLADGHVAIAATSSRIAIAWTTQKTLLERDPVGGYAVYACSK